MRTVGSIAPQSMRSQNLTKNRQRNTQGEKPQRTPANTLPGDTATQGDTQLKSKVKVTTRT